MSEPTEPELSQQVFSNAFVASIRSQRDQALDAIANLEGQLAQANAKIANLEEKLTRLREEKDIPF